MRAPAALALGVTAGAAETAASVWAVTWHALRPGTYEARVMGPFPRRGAARPPLVWAGAAVLAGSGAAVVVRR